MDYLNLEIRNEDQLAAEAIGHVSGPVTVPILARQIEARRELQKKVENGLDTPLCPELTNANPDSPHVVILEAISWVAAQIAKRFNQVPKQNHIAFANLFGIDQRAATPATTSIEFTVDPPLNTDVTIPAGTQVQTADGKYVFETLEALVIEYGDETGTTLAERTVAGHTLLSANVLTRLIDTPAYVTAVTNPTAVDSGLDLEPVDQTLERVRRYQRRGERIVTAQDLEEAIFDEGLLGNGIVRVFPFVSNGDFASGTKLAGHTTAVVMTRTGDVIDATASTRIAALLDQVVGNQFVYVVDPDFVEFDVEFSVRLNSGALESAVVALIETNLRNFYAASREQFGRGIYRSEIVAVIEGTAGVDRVESNGGQLLTTPVVDAAIAEYQIAKLVDVTIEVV